MRTKTAQPRPAVQPTGNPSPLDTLLRDAADRAQDDDVRRWLLALLRGERAEGREADHAQ